MPGWRHHCRHQRRSWRMAQAAAAGKQLQLYCFTTRPTADADIDKLTSASSLSLKSGKCSR